MNQQTSYSNMFQTIIMKSSIFIIIHTFQPHCAARTPLEIWPPYPFFFLRDDIHTRQTISVFACIGNTKKCCCAASRSFCIDDLVIRFLFCFIFLCCMIFVRYSVWSAPVARKIEWAWVGGRSLSEFGSMPLSGMQQQQHSKRGHFWRLFVLN